MIRVDSVCNACSCFDPQTAQARYSFALLLPLTGSCSSSGPPPSSALRRVQSASVLRREQRRAAAVAAAAKCEGLPPGLSKTPPGHMLRTSTRALSASFSFSSASTRAKAASNFLSAPSLARRLRSDLHEEMDDEDVASPPSLSSCAATRAAVELAVAILQAQAPSAMLSTKPFIRDMAARSS